MKKTPEQICQREESLRNDRSLWETHWQEIVDYVMPNVKDVINHKTPGQKKGSLVFDNTATTACEMLASALHGMLTNPNTFWFEQWSSDQRINRLDQVVAYLQEFTENLHNILNSSNFQTEIHQFYVDLCLIGTSCMTMEPNEDKVVHFSTKHISEYVISENNLGVVDELHRKFKWDSRQILEEFTKDIFGRSVDLNELLRSESEALENKFTKDVVDCYKNGRSEKFELVHAVYKSDLMSLASKPYTSQYILKTNKQKTELREGGFRRFPYLVARWMKMSGEMYGRSPSMTALPEVKSVNQMVKAVIKAAQKVVDPPTQGPDDGFLRPLKTAPGSHHYYRAGSPDRIEAIFKDINPRIGFELIRDRQQQIREAYFVDKLNLFTGDRMTTVEVNQRIEEQLRFLSPMLGRQRFEVLIPLIDNLVDIVVDADAGSGDILGDVPPEIQDVALMTHYTSPIARAQLVTQGQNMVRALEASAPFINLDQGSVDVINAEEAIRQNWKIYGAPQRVLRTNRELEDIKEARAEAQAQVLEQQQGMVEAEQISKLAPVLQG